MSVSRRLHTKHYEHESEDERYTVRVLQGGKPVEGIREDCISSVNEEVFALINACHIHRWFVQNVQFGADDGHEYYVHPDKVQQLLTVCDAVLDASTLVDGKVLAKIVSPPGKRKPRLSYEPGLVIENPKIAKKLLPPMLPAPHFKEYNASYLTDVRKTREWCLRMIDDDRLDVPGELYYQGH